MKKSENLLLYGLLFIVIIALIFSISTFFSKGYSQDQYNKFVSAEGENKCETPEGYTDKEWIEHMSHHPSQYKECLS